MMKNRNDFKTQYEQEILYQEGIDEAGHRDNDHSTGGDGVVDPGVLLQCSPDTQRNTNGNTDNDGVQVDEDGGRQLGQEDLGHVLTEVQLITDTPVKLGEDILQENTKLHKIGLVVTGSLTTRFNNGIVGISGGQFRRRQHADQHKADAGDDEQGHQHQQQTFDDIFDHNFSSQWA